MKVSPDSAADLIARLLKRRGVKRVFALCGGHIMPIWMRLDAEGIRIIDVRDERAAVHMAQAHAELTGELGVALVTAGPGMTNAITGIANAHVSRAPVLVLSGGNPRPQENRGGLQDMDHTQLVRSITRYARTVREPSLVLQELDEAISRAFGDGGEPGPAYIDFPTDTLRGIVPKALQLEEHLNAKPRTVTCPDSAQVERAVDLLWSARRVLVISGRGARGAGPELISLLDRLGAVYLDTGESRGLVPDGHPSVVGAMRGAVMSDADVILTVGRRLAFSSRTDRHQYFKVQNSSASAIHRLRCGTTAAALWKSSPLPPKPFARSSNMPAIASPRWTGNGPRSYVADTRSVPRSCSRAWRTRPKAPTASCIRTRCFRRFSRPSATTRS